MQPETPDEDQTETMTLEAWADTIIPGEKRWPGDRAIAGVSTGGGAVAAGAIEVLHTDAGGLGPALPHLVTALNGHATTYATEHGIELDDTVPPFVALESEHRIALVEILCKPGHPEKQIWVNLAVFSNMAWDTGAHLSTPDAIEAGHPGLIALGFRKPDADRIWRFSDYTYGRQLAQPHPDTTPSGSPA
jgi:enediyne biosynthesis protein E8